MLSYIYQISYYFERTHGYRPNILSLNHEQFQKLREDFDNPDDVNCIINHLNMQVLISQETLHPHVAHIQRRSASAVRPAADPSGRCESGLNGQPG